MRDEQEQNDETAYQKTPQETMGNGICQLTADQFHTREACSRVDRSQLLEESCSVKLFPVIMDKHQAMIDSSILHQMAVDHSRQRRCLQAGNRLCFGHQQVASEIFQSSHEGAERFRLETTPLQDDLKPARGRRGLELVEELKASANGGFAVRERDYDDIEGVDGKLVRLAKELGAEIITTDFNLNKVAQIQGVEVLNLNDLANALKPAVLPGETLRVKVIREGREYEQGVGYLADGTMIVVEGGKGLVGQEVDAEVTSVLQSSSGKMVFTKVPAAQS